MLHYARQMLKRNPGSWSDIPPAPSPGSQGISSNAKTDSCQQLIYDYVTPEDLETALIIENEAFPPDEAEPLETLQYRQTHSPELFLGAYHLSPTTVTDGDSSESPESGRPPRAGPVLVGFINGTVTHSETLTKAAMSSHTPLSAGGTSLCLHSISVDAAHRGRGIASALLKEFIRRAREHNDLESSTAESAHELSGCLPPSEGDIHSGSQGSSSEGWGKYRRILLITHDHLIPFYARAGFELLGESEVVHGNGKWYAMRMALC